MKTFMTKVTSAAAAAVALFVGCALAGLGLVVMALLAMFALAATGLALLAAPFMPKPDEDIEGPGFRIIRENKPAA
ncbi:hypothetical protein [Roseibium sp. MMSF_3412]|uniref:hypothetical protein n=1 Tax=unclassified Roseibium TaxID=2629323 RepID=UPI00273F4E63|nr:hypothetical protein [Roseibium sp. MMSF_3412]